MNDTIAPQMVFAPAFSCSKANTRFESSRTRFNRIPNLKDAGIPINVPPKWGNAHCRLILRSDTNNCLSVKAQINCFTAFPKLTVAYIQFLGAAGTVTGSKHLINTSTSTGGKAGLQVLIDCGLFQGKKEWRSRNWEDTPVPAREIDAVILTHAHLDHCGWIPRLVREGFNGPIFATPSTIDLCGVVLPDSGHLQEEEANFHNQKGSSRHQPALPLYTREDADRCLQRFEPIEFGETRQVSRELSFRFVHAGHILGSAMVEVFLSEQGITRKFLFTGDIGRVRLNDETP